MCSVEFFFFFLQMHNNKNISRVHHHVQAHNFIYTGINQLYQKGRPLSLSFSLFQCQTVVRVLCAGTPQLQKWLGLQKEDANEKESVGNFTARFNRNAQTVCTCHCANTISGRNVTNAFRRTRATWIICAPVWRAAISPNLTQAPRVQCEACCGESVPFALGPHQGGERDRTERALVLHGRRGERWRKQRSGWE